MVRTPSDPAVTRSVLPRSRPITPHDLPLVTRVTDNLEVAHATAARLREVGAKVVIVEEPTGRGETAFCAIHPAQFSARQCSRCEAAICPGCIADARGAPLCRACWTRREERLRATRIRQLFALLVFVAFLYKVWDHLKEDAAQVQGTVPITIGIVQFAPKSAEGAQIIRQLNQASANEPTGQTLRDVADWFNREHARYTADKDRRFRVEIRGPFTVDVEPPTLRNDGDTWFQAMFRAWQYPQYFKGLARDHGVPIDDYTVKVFVVYGGHSPDMASHSRGSKKGRFATAFVSLDERNPGYPLVTIAHEVGHALGANDAYDPETSLSVHPEGFVEPFADPLYPQRYAELMAVDIPVGPNVEWEIARLDQLRVGHQSAADMGWIPPEQAKLFYTPPAVTPEERLDPATRPDDAPPEPAN
ncbi:MAG: hypothetical protein VX127_16095 [Myxococcota bacterium]|nr:hypothetical protein [Myxococcota bacterium]